MNKKLKMKICDWALLPVSAAMLVSGIELEITEGSSAAWIWGHIFSGILFTALIVWHIALHYKSHDWLRRLWKRPAVIKWLTISGILTLATGFWAVPEWIIAAAHTHIGALHGKFGFIMMLFVIIHIRDKIKFYRN